MPNRSVNACAVILLLSGAALAQIAPPQPTKESEARSARFQAGVDKAAALLEKDPRLGKLNIEQRKRDVEFVAGNLLFATLHEMGHAHIQEMGLPVLGREEDAADSYAVTTLLTSATNVSHDVLIYATEGWFLSALRNQKENIPLAFYDEHGMDKQRAYEIICLMVGSDPDKFSDLATLAKMPQDRQESCAGDYSNAIWSWQTVLKPHLRAPDQPKQKLTVTYGPAGDYPDIANAMRASGAVELVADTEANRYVWRRPMRFDVKSCGQPDLHWDLQSQTILICYEMAADFGQLYRDYGLTNDAFKAAIAQLGGMGKQTK
jgi:hypothetical protein